MVKSQSTRLGIQLVCSSSDKIISLRIWRDYLAECAHFDTQSATGHGTSAATGHRMSAAPGHRMSAAMGHVQLHRNKYVIDMTAAIAFQSVPNTRAGRALAYYALSFVQLEGLR